MSMHGNRRRFAWAAAAWAAAASIGREPARAQTAEAGRQIFAGRCAACHGTQGAGGELGPSIVARVPLRNDAELEAVIREGVAGAGMPAFPNLSTRGSRRPRGFPAHAGTRQHAGRPRTGRVALADGRSLAGVVLNQSAGELQLLGDDRRVHLLREAAGGRYAR